MVFHGTVSLGTVHPILAHSLIPQLVPSFKRSQQSTHSGLSIITKAPIRRQSSGINVLLFEIANNQNILQCLNKKLAEDLTLNGMQLEFDKIKQQTLIKQYCDLKTREKTFGFYNIGLLKQFARGQRESLMKHCIQQEKKKR